MYSFETLINTEVLYTNINFADFEINISPILKRFGLVYYFG